jgi:diguanylate cyclase (GGDEF)-like protein
MTDDERQRTARLAGLDPSVPPTLRSIETRRSHLRIVNLVLLLGLAGLVMILPAAASGGSTTSWPVRLGLLFLVTAFAAYMVEKERHLLRLVQMLLAERQRVELLAEAATHDPLTGLLNQATLTHRLEAALAQSKRHGNTFAVMTLDLDRFRALNSRFGSSACDLALVEVGRRLAAEIRSGDALARMRSDQFTVLLEHVAEPGDPAAVAQRLVDSLGRPFDDLPGLPGLSISVGVVVHAGGDKEQAADILRDAELARRLARNRKDGRIEVFDRTETDEDPDGVPHGAEADVPTDRR